MKGLKKSLFVNAFIIVIAVFLFRSISYSASDQVETENKNKDLLINTGNMQVVLSVPELEYNFLNTTKNDEEKKIYNFSLKNTGNIPIEYYEIRLVDQEGKVSTLPHKYLNFTISKVIFFLIFDFTISKDHGNFDDIKNLGDNDSILYYGYNLEVGKSNSFNLKMWIDNTEIDAIGKELYGAIEVTLYQKYDVYKNYVLYESPGSTNVPIKTSIYDSISSTIPQKDGYKFVGWEKNGGMIKYNPGDTYRESVGTTLYAVWDKV